MMPKQAGRSTRVAILDDYQNVALTIADWSAVQEQAVVTAFADHLSDEDKIVDRLAWFRCRGGYAGADPVSPVAALGAARPEAADHHRPAE